MYNKTLFLRVSATIEPHRSLLTLRYHELFDSVWQQRKTLTQPKKIDNCIKTKRKNLKSTNFQV